MTSWIIKNLWLIPVLPMLAAGFRALVRQAGAERRQTVAHDVSRGYSCESASSPGGAAE